MKKHTVAERNILPGVLNIVSVILQCGQKCERSELLRLLFCKKKKNLSLEVTILESYISSCFSGSPSHFYFTVVKNSLFCQNVKESKRARGGWWYIVGMEIVLPC